MVSRESEYGLEGLIVLARQPRGKVLLLQEIARARTLPSGFLARIFQKLKHHNLVSSHRGAVRGYSLARHPSKVRLRGIFEAIEGPDLFGRCIFRPRLCQEHDPCSLHKDWIRMRKKLRSASQETTLRDVASRGRAMAR
jgi:Rrf2 family protein